MEVLLAGESWITVEQHFKGWDHFLSTSFHDGATRFKEIFKNTNINVHHLYAHLVPDHFPSDLREMKKYDIIILSDIGTNSLLLPSKTWLRSEQSFNRLELLSEYVLHGGGLIMVGGYYSFQGIHAMARYKDTPIEEVLPVRLLPYDDRVEVPQGVVPTLGPDFPKVKGFPEKLPVILGYNKTRLLPDAMCIYMIQGDPLLAMRDVGRGRTAAWTTDIGPHWCPPEFLASDQYSILWKRILLWVAKMD